MQPIRQGDVILIPAQIYYFMGVEQLPHLTLAKGEATGHRHRISEGEAELYEVNGTLYMTVFSNTALLTHEEHKPIAVPQGDWMIRIQREYEPQDEPQRWRYVAD